MQWYGQIKTFLGEPTTAERLDADVVVSTPTAAWQRHPHNPSTMPLVHLDGKGVSTSQTLFFLLVSADLTAQRLRLQNAHVRL